VPSPIQAIRENPEVKQLQVEDWQDEATKEAELARVQQEIVWLHQEEEAITRRQTTAHCAEARRQHINRERARFAELPYTIEILCQQEQRQEPPLEQPYHQPIPQPLPPPSQMQIPHL
jgi:hypothetical protein